MTAEKIQAFLDITEMPKANFCKNIGMSWACLWKILHEDKISDNMANRINNFMSDRLKKLIELSK